MLLCRGRAKFPLLLALISFAIVPAVTRPFLQRSANPTISSSSSFAAIPLVDSSSSSSSSSSSRSLLAPTGCAASSSSLLTNGFFNLGNVDRLSNVLVAATMANDAYPWSLSVGGAPLVEVVEGLSSQQVAVYQRKVRNKYLRLGATSVDFVDYYSPTKEVAAHAVIIGTARSVFLVFRGTADLGQFLTSMDMSAVTCKIYNKTLQLYQAPYHSVMGAWPDVLTAVQNAIAATENPLTVRVFTIGHSLGGASACLSALLLTERGYRIGGVYAFGPYKVGTTCSLADDCWVSLYDRHLGDVTQFWWNNQDPVPGLLDYADGTSNGGSKWGHVPRNRGWVRIVGDACVPSSGTSLTTVCPPQIDATDGRADGVCTQANLQSHYPWRYLQRVARCALQQDLDPAAADLASQAADLDRDSTSLRLNMCTKSAIWTGLLDLPAPSSTAGDAGLDFGARPSTGLSVAAERLRVKPG